MAMGRVCKCVSKYYSLMVKIEPRRTVFLGRDIWHLPLLFSFFLLNMKGGLWV